MSENKGNLPKRLLIGHIYVDHYKSNLFAMRFLSNLEKIGAGDDQRATYIANFIQSNGAYKLFVESFITPQKAASSTELHIGFLNEERIGNELFSKLYHKLNHLSTEERAKQIMVMVLDPSTYDNLKQEQSVSNFSLLGNRAELITAAFGSKGTKDRLEAIFNGLTHEAIKINDQPILNIGAIMCSEKFINPKDDLGRKLDSIITADEINEGISFLKKLNSEQLSYLVPRVLFTNLDQMRSSLFRIEKKIPYLLIKPTYQVDGLLQLKQSFSKGPVTNSFFDSLRVAFRLKNSRLKDRVGASDSNVLGLKKDMNGTLNDVAMSLLVRAYVNYPEILADTLPRKVDLNLLIETIGGSERILGAYIGRAPLAGHRYLHKGQQPPQHVSMLLEILAKFMQEGREEEYIKKILEPEAHSRNRTLVELFSDLGWSGIDREQEE